MSETLANGKELLEKWHRDAEIFEKAHYGSATYSRMYNYLLGIPLVILTTFIASEVFVKMSKAVEEMNVFVNGMQTLAWIALPLSILPPILARLQTFLRFPERAMQHKEAAVKFGLLKNEIDKTLKCLPPENELCEKINAIQSVYASVIQESPSAGTISLMRAKKRIKK